MMIMIINSGCSLEPKPHTDADCLGNSTTLPTMIMTRLAVLSLLLFVGDVSNDANDYTLFFLAALLLVVVFCSDLYYCFAYHYYDQVCLLSLLKLLP